MTRTQARTPRRVCAGGAFLLTAALCPGWLGLSPPQADEAPGREGPPVASQGSATATPAQTQPDAEPVDPLARERSMRRDLEEAAATLRLVSTLPVKTPFAIIGFGPTLEMKRVLRIDDAFTVEPQGIKFRVTGIDRESATLAADLPEMFRDVPHLTGVTVALRLHLER